MTATAAGVCMIAAALFALSLKVFFMSGFLDALAAEVEATKGAAASAEALIDGFVVLAGRLVAEIAAQGFDPTQAQSLLDSLKASRTELAAKVAASPVPADPAVKPAPVS
jgi:hypothetical protein